MPDLVYLSLWLRGLTEETMLPFWARALEEFPVSSIAPGIRSLAIYPLEWGETPVLEDSFREGAEVAHVMALAAEVLHEDYAYEAQLSLGCLAAKVCRNSGPMGTGAADRLGGLRRSAV